MKLQGITIVVADLMRSRAFYEIVLGFRPGAFYEPTRWQPYYFNGQFFGIREKPDFVRPPSDDITNFQVDEIEVLWERCRTQAAVLEPLAVTPWGSYKFVVSDPDGYRLGFVAEGEQRID